MIKEPEKKKLVTVEYNGSITELGGISGPIINPCKIAISTLVKMLHNGKKIFEVNPADTTKKIRLSLSNVNKKNYNEPTVVTKAVEAPKVSEDNSVINSSKKKLPKSDFSKR